MKVITGELWRVWPLWHWCYILQSTLTNLSAFDKGFVILKLIGNAQTLQTCLRWNCFWIGFPIALLMMMMMVMIRVLRWWHGNALACGANDPMLQHKRQNIWSVQSLSSSSSSSIIPWKWFRHWQRHCKKYPLISSEHHHNCNHYQTWKTANHDMIAWAARPLSPTRS